ncbi:MAG: metallophosphoesterase [Eubacterium sp.]|nr:metallophosphoesterase [Eubacterium sp.]
MPKKEKVKKTPKQKAKKAGKVLLIIVLVIALLAAIVAVVNVVSYSSNRTFIREAVQPISFEEQLVPTEEDGIYTFYTDREFKIMQLTDVHLGGGCLSTQKDNMAINAVAAMVTAEKPDLVIVTGDVAYPVPHQAGTLNNKSGAVTFAQLMEKLGVYWCNVYGNHDTELYAYHSRKDISKTVYGDKEKYPHCLFQAGPDDIDGEGNYVINIKDKTTGSIIQSLFMLDSHSYVDGDVFGLLWKYDSVHENQVQWYRDTVAQLTADNGGVTPKSLAFFHIPLPEMKEASQEYRDNQFEDTENVQYYEGALGESDMVICSGVYNYGLFDAFRETGSTQGAFFGHDHLNNISLEYKDVRLTYGFSIDYLAYPEIYKYGLQRGCTLITVTPDGSFDCHHENYYQDKYQSVNDKEEVILDHGMSDDVEGAGAVFDFQMENNQ